MRSTILLGDVVDIKGGGTPSRSNPEFWGGPIPWATVKDFTSTDLANTQESITENGLANSATNVIQAGAVVIPTRMALGKAAINSVDMAINQDLKALLPKNGFHNRFLLHFLLSKADYLEKKGKGATVKGITLDVVRCLEVPRISEFEQRRIAGILDKAESIFKRHEKTLALSHALLRSIFLDMFGDPAKNPHRWDVLKLEDLGEVRGGLQVTKERDVLSLRLPYLRVANVYRDRLDLSEMKTIGLTPNEQERTKLQKGDVLIVEGHGNPDEIGRSSVWDGSIEPCVHQNHLIRFRPDERKLLPIYASHFLNSKGGRLQLVGAARTTSGLNTISTSKVRGVLIPVPPLKMQLRYAMLVDRLHSEQQSLTRSSKLSNQLSRSLSQRAFLGEL